MTQQVINLNKQIEIVLKKELYGNSEVKNRGPEMKNLKWLKSRFEMAGERICECETSQ